ncbi:MAG: diguanylate cyclase [Candidatus Aminicenantes bacterium]|nr:diguanylate cyclase [Candidatus Aminicenantes bacterium]
MPNDKLTTIISNCEESFFRDLLDHIGEAVCVMDNDLNILFWNQALEDLTGRDAEDMLDHPCKKNLLIQGPAEKLLTCAEDCPVKQSFKDKKMREYKAYMLHKEGFRIPAVMRILPLLNKDHSADISVLSFHEYTPKVSMPHLTEELRNMNMLDTLTGTGNRKYVEMNLEHRLDEMKKYGFPVGVLFCILDDIESINDIYGTLVKDNVIKMIGKTISRNIRFFEFVGRWDENAFMVILSNVNANKLDLVANKLRLLAEQSNIHVDDKFMHTTISVGAVLADSMSTMDSLVKEAEKLAQVSQKEGQNRVTLYSEKY